MLREAKIINTLCDFSLVFGFSEGLKQVGLDIMLDVVKGKQEGGIFPMVRRENKEQIMIRQLIKNEVGVDIKMVEDEVVDESLTRI